MAITNPRMPSASAIPAPTKKIVWTLPAGVRRNRTGYGSFAPWNSDQATQRQVDCFLFGRQSVSPHDLGDKVVIEVG